jgi:hypothetical protein
MYRAIKVRHVLVCQQNPAGSKYPYRVKTLEKSESRLDETRTVETVEVKAFNSLVEVAPGQQLLVVEGGVMTERAGRDIKSVSEWERIEDVIPAGAPFEKIKQALEPKRKLNDSKTAGRAP